MEFGMMKNEYIHKWKSILTSFGKYKYAALVLLIGMVLLVFPQGEKETKEIEEPPETEVALETKLEQILKHIHGVGDVHVLLTIREGASYEFQMNERSEIREGQEELEVETVKEMGFAHVRLDPELYLKQETASVMSQMRQEGITLIGGSVDNHDLLGWITACGVSFFSGTLCGVPVNENELIRDCLAGER